MDMCNISLEHSIDPVEIRSSLGRRLFFCGALLMKIEALTSCSPYENLESTANLYLADARLIGYAPNYD